MEVVFIKHNKCQCSNGKRIKIKSIITEKALVDGLSNSAFIFQQDWFRTFFNFNVFYKQNLTFFKILFACTHEGFIRKL